MKQTKYIYKVVHSMEEMEKVLNSENTNRLLANVLSIEQYPSFLIVWED